MGKPLSKFGQNLTADMNHLREKNGLKKWKIKLKTGKLVDRVMDSHECGSVASQCNGCRCGASLFSTDSITPTERNSTEKMKVTKPRPQTFFCFILWLPFLSVKLNNKELGQGKLFVGLGRQKEQ